CEQSCEQGEQGDGAAHRRGYRRRAAAALMPGVELEIKPDPTDEELAALERALAEDENGEPAANGSAWRRSGLDFEDE
ncbi:MAG: hypothetical protein ACRDN6_13670, partial [Gaiellaceae bacterium]